VGFISHMGSNTACGHYVAHIRVNGRWVCCVCSWLAAGLCMHSCLERMRCSLEVPAGVHGLPGRIDDCSYLSGVQWSDVKLHGLSLGRSILFSDSSLPCALFPVRQVMTSFFHAMMLGAQYGQDINIQHRSGCVCWQHYSTHVTFVCRWVIYNDEKVAESEHPPLDLGYMYMFKRCDA